MLVKSEWGELILSCTHVVFDESAQTGLREALSVAGTIEPVVALTDDLMIGPLGDIFSQNFKKERAAWWRHVLGSGAECRIDTIMASWNALMARLSSLTQQDGLCIWTADNPSEYTGFLCVLSQIRSSVPVSVVNVTKAYATQYNAPEVQYFVKTTRDVASDKFCRLISAATPIRRRDRARWVNNWNQLIDDKSSLRLLAGGFVRSAPDAYFDRFIIARAQELHQYQGSFRAVRLVGECLGRHPQLIHDAFVFWRIQHLIYKGILGYTGSCVDMRECTVWLNIGAAHSPS